MKKDGTSRNGKDLIAILCVVLAFVPVAIAAIYIALDVGVSNLKGLLTIDLPAFLWLGLTYFHYQRARTKRAAWLFALFPIAFVQTAFHAFIWISSTNPPAQSATALSLGGRPAGPAKSRSEMITLMTKYGKQGKWDDAIRVAQEWLKSHPEDNSGVNGIVYEQIAMVYLAKASRDGTHKDEWIRQAVAYFDKDLAVPRQKPVDVEYYSAGRGFEEAGDLSTADSCLYYGRALKAFVDEVPFIQGETYTTYGATVPLAPMRQENEKSKARVEAKFSKAGCK